MHVGILIGASSSQAEEVTLRWTAPAENGSSGGAASFYEMRAAGEPVGADTAAWWDGASPVAGLPVPSAPGSVDSVTVDGLAPGTTVWFVARSGDEADNLSGFSLPFAVDVPDSVPPEDPPALLDVAVDPWLTDSVRVRWTADRPAAGLLRYGTDPSYGSVLFASAPAAEQTVWLTGLPEGEAIHFQIVASNAAGRDSTTDSVFLAPDPPPAATESLLVFSSEEAASLVWWPSSEEDISRYVVSLLALERSETPLFLETDFDDGSAGSDPAGFTETDSAGAPADLFRLETTAGRGLTLRGAAAGGQSRLLYEAAVDWSDWEMSGSVRFTAGAGADLFLLASGGDAYRIGIGADGVLGASGEGEASLTARGGVIPPYDPDVWYRFRVLLREGGEALHVTAAVWPEGTEEPERFPLRAIDEGAGRPSSGAFGFGVRGEGDVWFDGIRVTRLPEKTAEETTVLAFHNRNGLDADSSYHFWISAQDQAGGTGVPAGPAAAFPTAPDPGDTTAPAGVSDLAVAAGTANGEARLRWTATGDDGESGRASSYDLRWAADTLHEGNWSTATVLSAPVPAAAGSPESLLVDGLPAGTDCRFGLIVADEAGNRSTLSNVARHVTAADTTAPAISAVEALEISHQSARIDWDLNEPGDGQVEYGKSAACAEGVEGEDAFVLHHHVFLGGLDPATIYHYRVRSFDESGNEAVSEVFTFTTEEAPPPAPPVIADVRLEAVSDSDAVVLFTTDIPAAGGVDYGLTLSYGETAEGESTGTSHRILLAPLLQDEVYHFRVRASSAGGETVGEDRAFHTAADQDPPVVSGVEVSVTDSSARVAWTTDEEAIGFVQYGPDGGYGESTAPGAEYRFLHEAILSGLAPSSTVHFRIRVEDHHGNAAYTAESTFTTAGQADPDPPVLSDPRVEEVTHRSAAVLWSTDEAAYASVRYGTDSSCADDTVRSEGTAAVHRVDLSGLDASVLYYCRAVARDGSGNEAVSDLLTFTTGAPPDTSAPVIAGVRVGEIDEEGVTVHWTTGEESRGSVHYGTSFVEQDSLREAGFALEHAIRLDGLEPGGSYLYRITAVDSAGNRSETEAFSFTLASPDTTPPAVIESAIAPDGEEAALVLWTGDEPARGWVEFGPDSAYGSATPAEESLSTAHEARIAGLQPGSTIHYRIVQEDGAGNIGRSEDALFILPGGDGEAPTIVEMKVTDTDAEGATVFWRTDELSCGRILFGPTASCADSTPADEELSKEHALRIEELSPLTLYFYRVCCSDTAGNSTLSPVETFMTEGYMDSIPPRFGHIELADLGGGRALVRWETDEPCACSVVYGPDSTLGSEIRKRDVFGVSHRFDLEGLETGRTYYFRAAARDTAGNEALSEILSLYMAEADTGGTSPALDVRVEAGIRDAAVIWETGGPTSGRVDYGTDASYPETVRDDALVTAHRIVLEGLDPSTLYHYRISGEDAEGHLLQLEGLTFRTLPDTLPEVTAMAARPGENGVRLFWTVDRLARGAVEIAPEGSDFEEAAGAGDAFTYEHADTVAGLEPDRVYSWRVRGTTRAGVEFLSPARTFRTAEDATPPPAPFALTAEREGRTVHLAWENGEGEAPDSLILSRRLLPGGEWTVIWIGSAGATEHADPLTPEERAAYEKAEYRLEASDGRGNRSTCESFTVEIGAVPSVVLLPNRPNPFNPTTTIGFELPPGAAVPVRLAVYNIRGEEVRLLIDENLPGGRRHEVLWDGSDYRGNPVASGAYYYRITAPAYSETRKMVLIR